MKKQIKILLISVVMAVIILLVATTTVKAETYNIPAVYGAFADDFRTNVTFTLPEDITGTEGLTNAGWTVNGDTATKEFTRGSSYYYEQTNEAGDVYKVVVAVPMKYSLDQIITLHSSYTDITLDDSTIAEISDHTITPTATGRTKLHAKKTTDNGTVVEYVWDLTIVDSDADDSYYNHSSWEFEITGEENDLELKVGDEESIQVDATLDDEITPPSTASNPFEVKWTVGDASIVSITDTKGDKITNTGKIGSVKLNALKAGTTTVTVQVRIEDATERVWTATKTITVTEATTDEGTGETGTENETENGTGTDTETPTETQTPTEDSNAGKTTTGTEATEKIVQAGSNVAIVLFVIAGFAVVAVISKKKISKNKF